MTSIGMQLAGHISIAIFGNRMWKVQFCCFPESVNYSNLRAASKLKFLIFYVHTLSHEMEKKPMNYTNKNWKRSLKPAAVFYDVRVQVLTRSPLYL